MNIIIFGAGALGTYIGGLLSKNYKISLIGHGEHIRRIKENGITLRGHHSGIFKVEASERIEHIPDKTLIILTVKAYDLMSALKCIKSKIKGDTVFLLIQNGIGIKERAESIIRNEIIRCVTGIGSEIIYPGVVKTSWGKVVIENSKSSNEILNIFIKSGFDARISEDIRKDEWLKLCINSFVNPLTAILRVKTYLLASSELRNFVEQIIDEVIQIAKLEGITIERQKVIRTIERLKVYHNYSSMYQDIQKSKRTEIDFITGEILKRGKLYGIDLPANKLVYSIIKFLEKYGYQ